MAQCDHTHAMPQAFCTTCGMKRKAHKNTLHLKPYPAACVCDAAAPLLCSGDDEHGVLADMRWSKWGFWMVRSKHWLQYRRD
jgi:hypothetical protein